MKTNMIPGLVALAGLTSIAGAGLVSESENNNSLALANDVGSFGQPGGSILADGTITSNDVDWFSFTLDDTAALSFFALFSTSDADGIMQIVAEGGDVIAFDDNSGLNNMPTIQLENLAAGTYYIGLSGFGDVDSSSVDSDELIDGLFDTGEGHGEEFGYKLSIGFTVVPAPGACALFTAGGLIMTRRSREK